MDQVRESNPIQVIKSGIPDSMSEHTRIRVFEINFRRLGISYGTSPQSVSLKLYDTVIQSTVSRTLHRTPPGNRYFAGYESLSTSGTWKQRSTTRQVRGITVVDVYCETASSKALYSFQRDAPKKKQKMRLLHATEQFKHNSAEQERRMEIRISPHRRNRCRFSFPFTDSTLGTHPQKGGGGVEYGLVNQCDQGVSRVGG